MYNYNIDPIKRDSEFKYYLFGFVAADGWISDKSNDIQIEIKGSDVGLLKIFRDIVCPGKPIQERMIKLENKLFKACCLKLSNKEIKEEFMKYFNTTKKTQSLIFPYGIPDS